MIAIAKAENNGKVLLPDNPKDASYRIWRRVYDAGFNLLPLHRLSKEPIPYWDWWQEMRQDTRKYWEFYHTHWPCAMGLITGKTWDGSPGVVVVDADSDEAETLVKERCPDTPMRVVTGSGHLHRYYRHPGEKISQILGVRIGGVKQKLDIKGDGNYVVAPGSVHKSGNIYRWSEPFTAKMVAKLPVFDPAWLPHERLTKEGERYTDGWRDLDHEEFCRSPLLPPLEQRLKRVAAYLRVIPGTKQGDGASGKCLWVASKVVWGFAIPEETAIDIIMDQWAEKDDQTDEGGGYYPWKYDEIRHKVRDAIKSPGGYRGEPGDMVHPYAQLSESMRTLIDLRDQRALEQAETDQEDDPEDLPHQEDEGDLLVPPEGPPPPPVEEPDDFQDRPPRKPEPTRSEYESCIQSWSQVREIGHAQKEDWLIPQWLEFGCLLIFTGAPFSGKSTLLALLFACMARRLPFLGFAVQQVPIILFDFENRERILTNRLEAALDGDDGDMDRIFHRINPSKVPKPLTAEYINVFVEILRKRMANAGGKGLVVIDTFRSAFVGAVKSENDSSNLSDILVPLKDLAMETGWAILILHHHNKTGGYSGGTGFTSNADYHWDWETDKKTLIGTLSLLGGRGEPQDPLRARYNRETRRTEYVGAVKADGDEIVKSADDTMRERIVQKGRVIQLLPYGRAHAATAKVLEQSAMDAGIKRADAREIFEELRTEGQCKWERDPATKAILHWRDPE
jgi:hypothetical protein